MISRSREQVGRLFRRGRGLPEQAGDGIRMCRLRDLGEVHGPFRAAMVVVDIRRSGNDLGIKNLNLTDAQSVQRPTYMPATTTTRNRRKELTKL